MAASAASSPTPPAAETWSRSSRSMVREVAILLREDLLAFTRSFQGLATLALYLGLNLLVAIPYLRLSRFMASRLPAQTDAGTAAAAAAAVREVAWLPLFSWLTGDEASARLMLDLPVQPIFVFTIAAAFVPLVAILVSHDRISAELQSGHIRFLTSRCRRVSLLLGRFTARCLVMATMVCLVGAGTYLLMLSRDSSMDPGAGIHFFRYTLLLAALGSCYVALGMLCSTLSTSPFSALLMGLLCVFGMALLNIVSDSLGPLTPMHYKGLLYSPTTWGQGLLAYLGFTCAFTALAWLRLETRDL